MSLFYTRMTNPVAELKACCQALDQNGDGVINKNDFNDFFVSWSELDRAHMFARFPSLSALSFRKRADLIWVKS